jgi:hypothetical protein
VEGLRTIAARNKRARRIKIAQKPTINRSLDRRSGARVLERLSIISWCFTSSDSATTGSWQLGNRYNKVYEKRDYVSLNHRKQINGYDKVLKSPVLAPRMVIRPPQLIHQVEIPAPFFSAVGQK